jgi:CDP-glucose 4,6-dehydratase
MSLDRSFWRGKRVLVTGHTGFKGSWLCVWLKHLGASVCGVSLPPSTTPNLFELAQAGAGISGHCIDIRDARALAQVVQQERPEIVLHLAAQALVRASYRDPLETFSTNVMGTAHVLDAMRRTDSVRVAVMVTTDKVYENRETFHAYRETDALGGHDPYSASKAASELLVASYRNAFLAQQGVAVASARAGNVIGGGDWSQDRLIPDAVRAWHAGEPLTIRSPHAIRPWQHVLEPLAGYMGLAQALWEQPALAGAYNFGPHAHESATVEQLLTIAQQTYPQGAVHYERRDEALHETSLLTLETAKALHVLGIRPRWNLQESVSRTMRWYQQLASGVPAAELMAADIRDYEAMP